MTCSYLYIISQLNANIMPVRVLQIAAKHFHARRALSLYYIQEVTVMPSQIGTRC